MVDQGRDQFTPKIYVNHPGPPEYPKYKNLKTMNVLIVTDQRL